MSAAAPADAVVMRIGAGVSPRFVRVIPHPTSGLSTGPAWPGGSGWLGPAVSAVESLGMSNRTYRVTEIVGTSPDGIDEAIRNAIRRASTTLRHVDWFEVTQVRGQIKDGSVEHFQVGMKVGFRLEDE